uniref:NB-ARC domain-containing protein n=2 Tax=Aegilops tauschii TaxID=37682 RepID=A0A452ZSB2_AEGTS
KGFTEEQENALQLLTSLQTLGFFDCTVLQSLPQGLQCLSSLKELHVGSCPEFQCLPVPEESFPTSLQVLILGFDSFEQREQAEKWKEAYPYLRVLCYEPC